MSLCLTVLFIIFEFFFFFFFSSSAKLFDVYYLELAVCL